MTKPTSASLEPLLRQCLGTIGNPELIVYRVVPARVRYMQEWALSCFEVPLESEENTPDSPENGHGGSERW